MPAIDERARHELFVAVQDKLGPANAETLMSLLPPVGWADIATKHDLHELEARIDLRFARLEERFNAVDERFTTYDERLEGMEQRILATVHRALAEQTRTLTFALVGAMASMASVSIAAMALLR